MNQTIPLIIRNLLSCWSGKQLDGERMFCLEKNSKTDNYLHFLYVLIVISTFYMF